MTDREAAFWERIVKRGLPRFRWFRRPVPFEVVDAGLQRHPDWPRLRSLMEPDDEVWPFRFPRSRRVWGHREGYVALRRGRFVGGIVTISS